MKKYRITLTRKNLQLMTKINAIAMKGSTNTLPLVCAYGYVLDKIRKTMDESDAREEKTKNQLEMNLDD